MPRLIFLAIFIFALSGCSHPGRIVDSSGVVYSEYYQCKLYSAERDYTLDALATLGNERLPESYELTESQKNLRKLPDTILEVTEVYISNHRTDVLVIGSLKVSMKGVERSFSPRVMEIESGGWSKTEPIVDVASIYAPLTLPCRMSFSLANEPQEISGEWRRLTVEELSH